MSESFLEKLIDLGISATIFGIFFAMFLKIHFRSLDDAKEDRERNRQNSKENTETISRAHKEGLSEVASALQSLIASHRMRDESPSKTTNQVRDGQEKRPE